MVLSLEAHMLGGMNINSEGTIINFLINSRGTRGLHSLPWRYHRTKNSHWSQDDPRGRMWVTRRGRLSTTSLHVHVQSIGGTPKYLRNSLIGILQAQPSPPGEWQGMGGLYINGSNEEFPVFHEWLPAVCLRFMWVTNCAECPSVEEGDKAEICFSPSSKTIYHIGDDRDEAGSVCTIVFQKTSL